jgi:hypothetical protein
MRRRVLDTLLLVGIACGGVLAWRTGVERSRLEAKHERLARITGDMPIHDATKIHILALDTGEPLHFAWRVYLPPNSRHELRAKGSGGSSSWGGSSSMELIARVRFRDDPERGLEVFTHFAGGSSRMGVGDKALAERLRGRWDKVLVDQRGRDHLEIVDPKQSTVLLRLILPLDPVRNDNFTSPAPFFWELTLGPPSTTP